MNLLWLRLGWRNLWRNPGRTLVQALAIAGGLTLALFTANLTCGSYAMMIREGARAGRGHVLVCHCDWLRERQAELTIPAEAVRDALASEPGVLGAFARLQLMGLAQSSRETRGVAIVGIDFAREAALHPLLASGCRIAGELPLGALRDRAYVGERLAKQLQIEVGQKMVLSLQDRGGRIVGLLARIAGIYRTGIPTADAQMVFVDRARLAAAFGSPGEAHEVAVLLADPAAAPGLLGRLGGAIALPRDGRACDWQEAMPEMAGAIRTDRVMNTFIMAIIFGLIALGAVNTLLMNVAERTREFGLLKALGVGPAAIRRMVVAEAFALALLGTAAGVTGAGAITWYFARHGLDLTALLEGKLEVAGVLFEARVYPRWDLVKMAWETAAMVVLVLLAAVYPSRHALRISPADAMRTYQ